LEDEKMAIVKEQKEKRMRLCEEYEKKIEKEED
jgi:hypothetical protein